MTPANTAPALMTESKKMMPEERPQSLPSHLAYTKKRLDEMKCVLLRKP